MRIGELADATGVPTKTIRYWEAVGLLPEPARTPSGYRDYDAGAADRLTFIRRAQGAGLRLAEIKVVLEIRDTGGSTCAHVRALIDDHVRSVEQRMEELARAHELLRGLADRAAEQDPADCRGYCSILAP